LADVVSAREKADRLLAEGRVIVTEVTKRHIDAVVRGDSGVRRVVYGGGQWRCSCPAWGGCSHVMAVQLVTSVVVFPQWVGVAVASSADPAQRDEGAVEQDGAGQAVAFDPVAGVPGGRPWAPGERVGGRVDGGFGQGFEGLCEPAQMCVHTPGRRSPGEGSNWKDGSA